MEVTGHLMDYNGRRVSSACCWMMWLKQKYEEQKSSSGEIKRFSKSISFIFWNASTK